CRDASNEGEEVMKHQTAKLAAMQRIDPGGVVAISRGLSAATPPVASRPGVRPRRVRRNLNVARLLRPLPGRIPIISAATGGVAALTPRLIASTPPESR